MQELSGIGSGKCDDYGDVIFSIWREGVDSHHHCISDKITDPN